MAAISESMRLKTGLLLGHLSGAACFFYPVSTPQVAMSVHVSGWAKRQDPAGRRGGPCPAAEHDDSCAARLSGPQHAVPAGWSDFSGNRGHGLWSDPAQPLEPALL